MGVLLLSSTDRSSSWSDGVNYGPFWDHPDTALQELYQLVGKAASLEDRETRCTRLVVFISLLTSNVAVFVSENDATSSSDSSLFITGFKTAIYASFVSRKRKT